MKIAFETRWKWSPIIITGKRPLDGSRPWAATLCLENKAQWLPIQSIEQLSTEQNGMDVLLYKFLWFSLWLDVPTRPERYEQVKAGKRRYWGVFWEGNQPKTPY